MNHDDRIPKIIRLRAVLDLVSLSASSVYRLERAGLFPSRVRLGPNAAGGAVGYRFADIVAWIESRTSPPEREQLASNGAGQHDVIGQPSDRASGAKKSAPANTGKSAPVDKEAKGAKRQARTNPR